MSVFACVHACANASMFFVLYALESRSVFVFGCVNSFAFVSTLDRKEWDAIWTHLTEYGYVHVIMLDGDE